MNFKNQNFLNILYVVVFALCFLPFMSSALALILGIVFSILGLQNKFLSKHKSLVLQVAIVLMGFGMNLNQVIETSKSGFLITLVSVSATLLIGIFIGKLLKVEQNINVLIATGTAICGGSAIAAVSPIIKAKDNEISFALVVVFVLNAVALLIFPSIGHYFGLSQESFGQWAAIAIHDTSSVVGAGAAYGEKALEIATIVKLTRSLWIIPLSLFIAYFYAKGSKGKMKIPWFILYFIVAIIIAHFLPQFEGVFSSVNFTGKRIMIIALFLIGSNLSIAEVKKIGPRSFIQGILLWIIVSVSSLFWFGM
ncbi:MAG: YeiH family protein [Chitinophagales bacterium]